jgi:hypothetical protein
MATTAATPKIMPSMVSSVRSLCSSSCRRCARDRAARGRRSSGRHCEARCGAGGWVLGRAPDGAFGSTSATSADGSMFSTTATLSVHARTRTSRASKPPPERTSTVPAVHVEDGGARDVEDVAVRLPRDGDGRRHARAHRRVAGDVERDVELTRAHIFVAFLAQAGGRRVRRLAVGRSRRIRAGEPLFRLVERQHVLLPLDGAHQFVALDPALRAADIVARIQQRDVVVVGVDRRLGSAFMMSCSASRRSKRACSRLNSRMMVDQPAKLAMRRDIDAPRSSPMVPPAIAISVVSMTNCRMMPVAIGSCRGHDRPSVVLRLSSHRRNDSCVSPDRRPARSPVMLMSSSRSGQ